MGIPNQNFTLPNLYTQPLNLLPSTFNTGAYFLYMIPVLFMHIYYIGHAMDGGSSVPLQPPYWNPYFHLFYTFPANSTAGPAAVAGQRQEVISSNALTSVTPAEGQVSISTAKSNASQQLGQSNQAN